MPRMHWRRCVRRVRAWRDVAARRGGTWRRSSKGRARRGRARSRGGASLSGAGRGVSAINKYEGAAASARACMCTHACMHWLATAVRTALRTPPHFVGHCSGQPRWPATVDGAIDASFKDARSHAKHVQVLLLLLAEHCDKEQQVDGGVVHRLQLTHCRAGRALPRWHRHELTHWSCSIGCSPSVETRTSLLAPLHSARLRAPRAAQRHVRRGVRVGGGGGCMAGLERVEVVEQAQRAAQAPCCATSRDRHCAPIKLA